MTPLQYVQASEVQEEIMENFRNKFEVFYQEIKDVVPENRARSLALTKLEESAMWLNKAITNNC